MWWEGEEEVGSSRDKNEIADVSGGLQVPPILCLIHYTRIERHSDGLYCVVWQLFLAGLLGGPFATAAYGVGGSGW